MVAMLVFGHILILARSDGVVLQLAHHLELHTTRSLTESAASLLQGVLRSHLERLTVLGVERAKQVECRHLGEGVEEGGAETWDDVKVRIAGLDVGEQRTAVHSFTAGQHLVGMCKALNHEVERMQTPVIRHIAEVDHLDLELLDDLEDISLGELSHRLFEKSHQRVRVEFQMFLCHWYIY